MSNKMDRPLVTVDGRTLMDRPLEPPNFVVDTLISQGLHILAGSPKVGKSWLALWLAVTVAKGEPVWGMSVKQGTTLYLCLEDSVLRIQNRLFEITEDAPDSVHFCTECAPIGQGLEEQVEGFLVAHPDTVEMSRNVQSGNTQNLKSTVIQRSFPKWSVAERRKTAAASDQAAVCACAHSRYFAGGSPSGLRV